MENTKRKFSGTILKRIIQISPFVMIAVMAVLYFVYFRNVTVRQLVTYVPDDMFLAVIVLLAMFALKSMSYFFPMLALYAVSGSIFGFGRGLLVNIAGTLIMISIPYLIGRFAERELVDSLIRKSSKAERINEMRTGGQFFASFFLRVISCLPCDVVSLVLGSAGIEYRKYVAGSLLGILPGIISATLMGDAADDPLSPKFIGGAAFNVVIAVTSAIIYAVRCRKKKRAQ